MTTVAEIPVTMAEHSELARLASECSVGYEFDEIKWLRGVRSILGPRVSLLGFGPTAKNLVVVHTDEYVLAKEAFDYLKKYLDREERNGKQWIDADLLLAYQRLRAAVKGSNQHSGVERE